MAEYEEFRESCNVYNKVGQNMMECRKFFSMTLAEREIFAEKLRIFNFCLENVVSATEGVKCEI